MFVATPRRTGVLSHSQGTGQRLEMRNFKRVRQPTHASVIIGAKMFRRDVSAEHMPCAFGHPLTLAEKPCKNSASRKRWLKTHCKSEFARKALT